VAHRSIRRAYFWTSLASNLYFRTHYDAKGAKSRVFGAVESSVEAGFCGQTLPPAADTLWEKSQSATSTASQKYPRSLAGCQTSIGVEMLERVLAPGIQH
jgi:hypothetical protein